MSKLNRAQTVVLVVALGAGLLVLGRWLTHLGSRGVSGWTGYAPLSNGLVATGGLQPWARLVICLVLIVFWAAISLLLLRSRVVGREDL
ncbi:MAG: hypothetical protein ACYCSF_04520 [Acidimicrobiales bacterium]